MGNLGRLGHLESEVLAEKGMITLISDRDKEHFSSFRLWCMLRWTGLSEFHSNFLLQLRKVNECIFGWTFFACRLYFFPLLPPFCFILTTYASLPHTNMQTKRMQVYGTAKNSHRDGSHTTKIWWAAFFPLFATSQFNFMACLVFSPPPQIHPIFFFSILYCLFLVLLLFTNQHKYMNVIVCF